MEIGILLFIVWVLYIWYSEAKDVTEHSSEPPGAPYKAEPTTKTWNRPKAIQGTVDYEKYIRSSRWIEGNPRLDRLLLDNYSCIMCGEQHNLQVHHIHYDNLGYESQKQLATLCADCHNQTHLIAGKGAKTYPPIRKLK